jgi:hypothetical protein
MSNHTRRVLHLRPGHGLEAYLDGGFVHFVGETGGHSVQIVNYDSMNRASVHAGGFAENNGATEDQALTFRVIVETLAALALEHYGLCVAGTLRNLGHVIAGLEKAEPERTLGEHQEALGWLATQLPPASCAAAVRALESAAWCETREVTIGFARTARTLLERFQAGLEPPGPDSAELACLDGVLLELAQPEQHDAHVRAHGEAVAAALTPEDARQGLELLREVEAWEDGPYGSAEEEEAEASMIAEREEAEAIARRRSGR